MYHVLSMSDRLSDDPTPEEIARKAAEIRREKAERRAAVRAMRRRLARRPGRCHKRPRRTGGIQTRCLDERTLDAGQWRTLPAGTTCGAYHGG